MTNITITLFDNHGAKTKREECLRPAALVELIKSTAASNKEELPWLKLARFGDKPSETGSRSLRHNDNVIAITGIEGDYDGERITMETVVGILGSAGIEAIVYPSPSYTADKPRWRVLCPSSHDLPPDKRDHLMGRLEGLLRHILGLPAVLGSESWVLSQSYYFGRAIDNGTSPPAPVHVEGTPIDVHDDLDDVAVKRPSGKGNGVVNGHDASPPEAPIEDIAAAVDVIPNPWPDWSSDDSWEDWNKIGMAIYRASGGSEDGFTIFDRWSAKCPQKYDPDETRFRWYHYYHSPPSQIGAGTLFHLAARYQPGWASPSRREIDRLAQLSGLQYTQERKAAAKRLKCGVLELDRLVRQSAEPHHSEDAGKKSKQADVLIALARDAGLFHTPDDAGYADIRVDGHRETWPTQSKMFKRWLTHHYFKETGEAPNSDAMQSALGVIEAKAQFEAAERALHVRIGEHDNKIYIDLADEEWHAVEIDTDGWRVVDEPPVRFRRAAGMRQLPTPKKGGSVKDLRPFLNVQTNEDFILLVTCLVAALRGRGPYRVLEISGEAGTAKSTLARVLRSLIDPSSVPLQAPPSDERDVFIGTCNSYVTAFDNISYLPDWLSDALCRLSTGGGLRTRSLYTNDEEALFDAMRPVILIAINNVVVRGDLADRELRFPLKAIPDGERRDETEFWASFHEAQPGIFGALLDAVAHGLKTLPTVHLPELPRMADFAIWGVACEGALWERGAFMAACRMNADEVVDDIIDRDQVAKAVRSLMEDRGEWSGTATALLEDLTLEVDVIFPRFGGHRC